MQKNNVSKASQRLGYVDAIRGIAAILVIYFHVGVDSLREGSLGAFETYAFTIWTQWLDLGKIAVTMFFAVSGFVVPYSLLRSRTSPVRDFIVGRFFRLYPAYWMSIPFGILAYNSLHPTPIDIVTVLGNITMFQQFIGIENIIGVYWTLQIELIFYFICVLLFVAGLLRSNAAVFWTAITMLGFALLLASARYVTGKGFPVALGLAMAVMYFGLLWRRNVLENDISSRKKCIWFLVIFSLSLPLISWLGYGSLWLRYIATYYVAIIAFMLLTTKLRLNSPVLVYLGAISYSVYLFGPPCTSFVVWVLPHGLGGEIHAHLIAIVSIILTICVSSVVYKFVEKPSVRLGRRVIKRLETTQSASSSNASV